MSPVTLFKTLSPDDPAVEQALREAVVAGAVERAAGRIADVVEAVDAASQRIAKGGFGALADALRASAQAALLGLLDGSPTGPVPTAPTAARSALPVSQPHRNGCKASPKG